MSIRRNAQGASSVGKISDRLREVLLIGQRHGGIGRVEILTIGAGTEDTNKKPKRSREPEDEDEDDLTLSQLAEQDQRGPPQDVEFKHLPSHLNIVINEHETRINECYSKILQQVRQVFKAEDPSIVTDSILIHYATIFIAYYLTFAISPSFINGIAPVPASSFWKQELKYHYVNTTIPPPLDDFNRITKLALNFVWWSHKFEEVCTGDGVIQQPLANTQVGLVGEAMLWRLRKMPNAAHKLPSLDTTTRPYPEWRLDWTFDNHYEVPKQVKYLVPIKPAVSVYTITHREKRELVVVKEFSFFPVRNRVDTYAQGKKRIGCCQRIHVNKLTKTDCPAGCLPRDQHHAELG